MKSRAAVVEIQGTAVRFHPFVIWLIGHGLTTVDDLCGHIGEPQELEDGLGSKTSVIVRCVSRKAACTDVIQPEGFRQVFHRLSPSGVADLTLLLAGDFGLQCTGRGIGGIGEHRASDGTPRQGHRVADGGAECRGTMLTVGVEYDGSVRKFVDDR